VGSLAQTVEQAWARPPGAWWLLYPLELLYAGVTRLRRSLFRRGWLASGHPGVPVIVIGNISVGGTGKTPAVIALAGALQARGLGCAVVSRGYGARIGGVRRVDPDSRADEVGDEPLLMARRLSCPVYVAPDRLAGARRARADGADVILCDDGLQHYRLQRDVEVAVIDAAQGFGNGHLLPLGPLREPRRRLATVDFVLERGGRDPASAYHVLPGGFRSLDGSVEREPHEPGFGPAVHALAGIARPERFFAALRELGLEPVEHPLPDHEAAPDEFFPTIGDLPLVMTAKDSVKYAPDCHPQAWVLEVRAEFPAGWVDALLARAGLASAATGSGDGHGGDARDAGAGARSTTAPERTGVAT
jgi:tetraacyldisaccharide 4'-kinase